MPYITDKDKTIIAFDGPRTVSQLTYVIQQILSDYIEGKYLSYQTLAECLGALEGVKADFIDRVLLPYEREKRRENGDVWTREERPA